MICINYSLMFIVLFWLLGCYDRCYNYIILLFLLGERSKDIIRNIIKKGKYVVKGETMQKRGRGNFIRKKSP